MLGISYSKNVPIYGISATELLSRFIIVEEFYNTLIIICSTNNQNFMCLPVNHKNYRYKILSVIDQRSFNNINLNPIL